MFFCALFSFSIYEKLIQFCGIDELGTNYPKDMFDPHGWSEDSYYEGLGEPVYFVFAALCEIAARTLMYACYCFSQSPESGDGQTGESEEGENQGETGKKKEDREKLFCRECCVRGMSPPAADNFDFYVPSSDTQRTRVPSSPLSLLSVQLRPNPSLLLTTEPCHVKSKHLQWIFTENHLSISAVFALPPTLHPPRVKQRDYKVTGVS